MPCCEQYVTYSQHGCIAGADAKQLGTIFGGIYAALGQHACNGNPYGLVAWMTAQSVLTAWIVLEQPAYSGLGIVLYVKAALTPEQELSSTQYR